MRAVVADDEPIMVDYLREVLPELGYDEVIAATTGAELVEACRRTRPDLVITDIRMPDLDGIEAARRIGAFIEVPIILISAVHDDDLIGRAQATTVLAYLVKPIRRPDLETAVAIARRRFEEIQTLRNEAGDLRQALEDRKIIERAKGVLVERMGVGENEAFARLRQVAMDERKKIVDVARVIVKMSESGDRS